MARVLAFGTYDKRKHPRVGILIDGLRKHGIQVDEIDRPLGLSTAERVEILKKPWKLFGFGAHILSLWRSIAHDAKVWMARNGRPDAVLVGYMGHFDVLLARHVFKGVPIILDHLIFAGDTARDRGAQGLKVRLLNGLDRRALAAAHLILLDTDEHRAMLPAEDAGRGMTVPVGAPDAWYAAGDAARHGGADRSHDIVFFGLYTPLQGTVVIAQAIAELYRRGSSPHVTMIGRGQDYQEVRGIVDGLDNVEFIDWVQSEDLPAAIARHDISLGIFSTTPKGLHVVPNKVYQSMAAGCAVVTSDTAPQRRMLGDGAVFVEPGSARDLADALELLLSDEAALRMAQEHARSIARRFTCEAITGDLASWVRDRAVDGD